MTPASLRATAVLHVRRPSGALNVFMADTVDIEHGVYAASGRWRYPSGRESEPCRFAWPAHLVLECRWEEA